MYIFALLGLISLGGQFRFVKTDAPRSNFDGCVAVCCTVVKCAVQSGVAWCSVLWVEKMDAL